MMETVKFLLGFLLESYQGEKLVQYLRLLLPVNTKAIPTEFLPNPLNICFCCCFNGYMYKASIQTHFDWNFMQGTLIIMSLIFCQIKSHRTFPKLKNISEHKVWNLWPSFLNYERNTFRILNSEDIFVPSLILNAKNYPLFSTPPPFLASWQRWMLILIRTVLVPEEAELAGLQICHSRILLTILNIFGRRKWLSL